MRVLVQRSSPVLWVVVCLVATTSVAISVDVLSVDTSDPAIKQFKAKAKNGPQPAAAAAPDELRKAVQGLKVPVLDLTKPPSFPATSPATQGQAPAPEPAAAPSAPKLTVSADETGKNWYSITREYSNPKVTITISADLRVQHAPKNFVASRKNKNTMEIIPSPRRPSKDEDFPAAKVTLYRYPNVPYVIDVECSLESRYVCESKQMLAKLTKSLGLIEAP
jgi:hypothetical protein